MTGHMISSDEIRRRLHGELALPSRIGHTLLLLASLGSVGISGALLLTESALPARARVALTLSVAVGIAWSSFATWVLAKRRVLLARHRVIAARMAVVFSALYACGSLGMTRWSGSVAAGAIAVSVGVAMVAIAVVALRRATQQVATLERRRAELERQLKDSCANDDKGEVS